MSELTATVITVSTRAAAGQSEDRSGPLIVAELRRLGFVVAGPVVVADGDPAGAALREALATAPDVVVTTGGTGITPTDRTPEQTAPLLDRQLPHVAAAIVRQGVDGGVPTAVLSRGLAGVHGSTFVVNLPGSTGGVRDGLAVLGPILRHVCDQLAGGDHAPSGPPA